MKEHLDLFKEFVISPPASVTLVAAGTISFILDPAHLQMLYLSLIIPPAAYHFYVWFREKMIPPLIQWFYCKS